MESQFCLPSPELGFVELLGLQDFQSFSSLMDFASVQDGDTNSNYNKNTCSAGFLECSSEVLNQAPTTPNSSISSASNEEHNSVKEEDEQDQDEQDQEPDEDRKTTTKELKPKKPANQKKKTKKKEPRVAFMTKSQVDHLEDGYRWRKYGQKAVKNSPFPRSYYRCTTASCNVKKRVERCFKDPSIVITTYEGQHIHPSPFNARGGGFLTNNGAHFSTIPGNYNLPLQMGANYNNANYNANAYLPSLDVSQIDMISSTITTSIPTTCVDQGRRFCSPPTLLQDNGLLQDIVMMPSNMRLNEG